MGAERKGVYQTFFYNAFLLAIRWVWMVALQKVCSGFDGTEGSDVLSKGTIDLLFEEAAVNDANMSELT